VSRRVVLLDKSRHMMKKADVEREISCLLDGRRVKVTSEVRKGRSYAHCVIGEWEYEGEAKNIDWAYRALLQKIRDEKKNGLLV